jgi:hypothetical protein
VAGAAHRAAGLPIWAFGPRHLLAARGGHRPAGAQVARLAIRALREFRGPPMASNDS